jgi:hypothetical protein
MAASASAQDAPAPTHEPTASTPQATVAERGLDAPLAIVFFASVIALYSVIGLAIYGLVALLL